jgi:hypothetical protein
MCVIPALRRLRQEDHKFEADLGYIISSRPGFQLGSKSSSKYCAPQSGYTIFIARERKGATGSTALATD